MRAVTAPSSGGRPVDPVATEQAPVATGRWFGPPARPLLGWLSTPHGGVSASGVLVLPAIGYPYWSSHRTLRAVAERLARAGHTVLRLDYDGTGDSSGDQWDADRLAGWRSSAAAGAAELRELGCDRLILIGVRLGGMLSLIDGSALHADAVVAWEPVTAGRRYVKEVRMLAIAVPESETRCAPGTLVAAGVVFTPQTLDELSALTLADIEAAPAPRTLVVSGVAEPKLLEHLVGLGASAEHRAVDGGTQALEEPAEGATVPEAVLSAICDWIGRHDGTPKPAPPESRIAAIVSDAKGLTEEVVSLGPDRLVGVISETTAMSSSALTAVFLNSGSEPHIGPGRAWVEYARALAGLGYRSVRTDFRGWGESPDDGLAPGRPYDPHCVDDTIAIVRALRDRGYDRVVLVGLCAGAWVALQAVLREPVDGVIALNPQLYWQPGDPVEPRIADALLRRAPERERELRGSRYGIWTALDALGHRPRAGRWLDDLVMTGVPISMLFAADDPGLVFLRDRLSRRTARAQRSGVVRVAQMPGIDHAMHRAWLRHEVVEALSAQLKAIAAA